MLATAALCLCGCQMFVPCHPGTWAIGNVEDLGGHPVKGATVSLYGSDQTTDDHGGFSFELADALPFTLTATANGYKSIEVPRRIGHFQIKVCLAPDHSSESSQVIWKKLGSKEYERLKGPPNQVQQGIR